MVSIAVAISGVRREDERGKPTPRFACSDLQWLLDRPVKPGDDAVGILLSHNPKPVIARLDRAIQYTVYYPASQGQNWT
jgi:hypothetical protein